MRHRQRRLGLACGLLSVLLSACGAGASAPNTPPAPPSALAVVTADQFAGAPPSRLLSWQRAQWAWKIGSTSVS